MKKSCFLYVLVGILLSISQLNAQKVKVEDVKHRRNSICLLLMDDASMPKRDTITEAFLSAPVPPKYNDHNVEIRMFDPAKLTVTPMDKKAFSEASEAGKVLNREEVVEGEDGKEKKKTKTKSGGGFGNFMKNVAVAAVVVADVATSESGAAASAAPVGTNVVVDTVDTEILAVKANKYLCQEKIAKQLVDKWFLINGAFDENFTLITERGTLAASDFENELAKNTLRGSNQLVDAMYESVGNTFVVASRFRYMSKEELVEEINAMTKTVAKVSGKYGSLINSAADLSSSALELSLGAGYYVRTTSYLFQLVWDEETLSRFETELWGKPEEYAATDLFTLKYIGQESAFANVKAGVFTKKSEGELIRIATVNATDAVLAKLEKKYDVFKTKTPIHSVDLENKAIYAKIGTREGVEAGDKYEVLEAIYDPESGRTSYKRKTTLKVAKEIWNNGLTANEENEGKDEKDIPTVTKFEGNINGLAPGMLLRQIK